MTRSRSTWHRSLTHSRIIGVTLLLFTGLLMGCNAGSPGTGPKLTSPSPSAPSSAPPVTTSDVCTYALDPTGATVNQNGGQVNVTVTTGATCPWTVQEFADWITVNPTFGVGPGNVQITVAANAGPPRSATVVIAGIGFVVQQQIVTLPDLSIASADIVFDQIKGSVVVAATVHNIGNAAASEVVVTFASDGTEFGRVTIESIAPGSLDTATVTWKVKGRKTGRVVDVTVDPDTAIPESDELNNTASAVLTLR